MSQPSLNSWHRWPVRVGSSWRRSHVRVGLERYRKTILAAAATLLVGGGAAVAVLTATPALAGVGVPTLSPLSVSGRGATVPFIEQEAEYADTNGTLVGPTRYYGQLASEASGRQAVGLDAVGEYVEFTLTAPANAMSLRYSLPDNAAGTGRDATMDIRVNNTFLKTLPVTSKYGWYYGPYPFNNTPGGTNPHHFYDEARTMFGSTLGIGTKVRVQVTSTAASPTFTIDLADFELVGTQIGKPTGAIDVVADFGADPTGGAADNTAKFQAAVDAGKAQGREVYIPAGTYTLWDHVVVDGVTLRGAGPWYTVLTGRNPNDRTRAVGVYGKYVNGGGYTGGVRANEANGPSVNVTLRDFAIIGDIRERSDDDQVNAIGGAMNNSTVDNVWLQHTKVGAWMDGPMTNFTIRNSRILDQTADAVNFHYGVSNSRVTNTFVRNSGDDGLAIWCQNVVCPGNSFDHNTVILPILANNIAVYGGSGTQVTDNVVADTISNGGGIHFGNRYPGVSGPTAVSGVNTVARNTTIRAGNSDFNWNFGVGAIWFWGISGNGATINVSDTDILDSSYEAIQFIEGTTTGVNFTNVRIDGAGTYALQIQAPGAASFTNVTATHIAQTPPMHNCIGTGFAITQGAGNSGWFTTTPYCGPWPDPIWTNGPTTPPTTTPAGPAPALSVSPSSLTFATQNLGTTSAAQTVTVTNSGTAAATLSGVTATGDFARTTTCGASLAAGASCTASVTFTPTGAGTRTGQLSVSSNAAGSPHTVNLTGVGFNPNGNLAAGKPTTETSHVQTYAAANAVDGNASTYWESNSNAFPQSMTVDLGTSTVVSQVVLKLPPPTAWATRTETITVQCSTNNSTFTTVYGPTGVTFNPATGNQASLTIPGGPTCRYVRVIVTGNTGWPAAQLSELEVYGASAPSAPAISLSTTALPFPTTTVGSTSAPQSVTVTNTGTAAATLSGVTATGDFSRTTTCGTSLAAGASCTVSVLFTPTAAGTRTGTLSVSSNASGSPHTVSLSGTGGTATTNLALGRATSESGHVDVYGSGNATDGNASSYWESPNNAFPQWIQVDLGAAASVGRVVLKLPPPSSWATRTQTVTVSGSTNGSTFTTLAGPTGATFNPATGNTATITFTPGSVRYLRLTFTANTGWPAGQLSEFEAYAS